MTGQDDILYTPSAERVVTTNAWAFLHWLRTTRDTDLADWAGLQRYSVDRPAAFRSAVSDFARLPEASLRLVRPLADVLLHADIRPDDCLLVADGASWPWLAAKLEGTKVVLATATSQSLLGVAADEAASVLVAPAQLLAEAAFQRSRQRPNLGRLRTIVATGGPLSPEGRTRVYTWIKSDVLLLARTGDTFWGNPLEPVHARPAATPAFFTLPASGPATR